SDTNVGQNVAFRSTVDCWSLRNRFIRADELTGPVTVLVPSPVQPRVAASPLRTICSAVSLNVYRPWAASTTKLVSISWSGVYDKLPLGLMSRMAEPELLMNV